MASKASKLHYIKAALKCILPTPKQRTQTIMTRTRSQEAAAIRDKRRAEQELPPFHQLDPQQKTLVLEAERAELFKTTQLTQRLKAWPLERYPFSVYPAPCSGILLLPRHYRSEFGCDQLKFREGDNLNLLTYGYYDERVDASSYSGNNFVTDGGIHPRRHEYLGPYPKVAGYRFTQGQAEIAFWDNHLKTAWIGTRKWDVELEFDPVVETWLVVER